ncbi:MAG: nitrile hydratase subunit beta, partial [Parasphingorhabdus sp.]
LGGKHGFGAIDPEINEPVFHEEWQATTFALMVVSQAFIRNHNADEYRHSIERMEPAHYLQAHYYERMLTGTTSLLVEKGVLDKADLEARAGGAFPMSRPVADDPVIELPSQCEGRFSVGDRVRVLEMHPKGHIRAPRFCRGKAGTVLHVAPKFNFPDTSAHGGELRLEHTYHVEFASRDLWPAEGNETDTVVVDLWDSYLEAIVS